MVESNIKELAVIFETVVNEDGILEEVPVDVVFGYYDELSDRFVDTNQYSYSHLIHLEEGKSYAVRTDIGEVLALYPNKTLEEIRILVFDEYSEHQFFIGTYRDEKVFLMRNKKSDETTLFIDKDLLELGIVFDEEDELEDEFEEDTIPEVTLQTKEINAHKLYEEIRKTVKGQDEAIKKIVTVIWKNYSSDDVTNNMLVVGPSGVGKTEIFRQLAKLLDIPLLVSNVSGLSQAGYVGNSTDSILTNLLALTKGDVSKAERAIVILDEFDKLAYTSYEDGKISTAGVQDELLKIVEDGTFAINTYENGFPIKKIINTTNITFVGVGAFLDSISKKQKGQLGFGNELKEKEISKDVITPNDLIGIKPELIGRMSAGGIIKLNELTIENIKDIIKNSSSSKYYSNINLIKKIVNNFTIDNEEEIIEAIAKKVIESKVKTGARGLSYVIEEMFSSVMFEISNPKENYKELIINKEIVNNPKKYVLKK